MPADFAWWLTLALPLACAATTTTAPSSQSAPRQAAPSEHRGERVILSLDSAHAVLADCLSPPLFPETPDFYVPSDLDVQLADNAFRARVRREIGEDPALSYYRQYAGLIVHSRRLIAVHGFAVGTAITTAERMPPFDWRKDPLHVCGGGAACFHGAYDPESKVITAFRFNPSM